MGKIIKKENYVVLQAWMVTELELKGNELLLYAIIYGFSQTDNQEFTGSINYFAEWLSSTRQTVITALKGLEEKGLITKKDRYVNNVKFCNYSAVYPKN